MMKAQDIFGLGIRALGVWLIVWGLWNLGETVGSGIQYILGVLRLTETSDNSDFVYLLIFAIFSPLLGFAVLINADAITQWVYRDRKPSIPPKLER